MVPRYTRPEMAAHLGRREPLSQSGSRSRPSPPKAWPHIGAIPRERRAHHPREGRAAKLAAISASRSRPHRRDRARDAARRHRLPHLARREAIGPESRFVHQGMTSSDVLDTCLSVQLTQATDLLLADLDARAGRAEARAPSSTSTRPPSAAATASTPSPPPSASSSPATTPSSPATARGCVAARAEIAVCAHQRRGRHLRPCRPARRSLCRRRSSASPRAGLHPGDPARPPRRLFLRPRRHRQRDRAAGDRGPPPAAHRGAGGRGVLPRRPEGLQRHAPQAQPGAQREPDRPRPPGPRRGRPGAGERGALARARHQPFQRGAGHRARTPRSRWTSRSSGWPG